jgi:hypothetical protein
MTAPKWTPGPWRYQEDADAYTHIVRAGESRFMCQMTQETSGLAEANARLIAAAPELYEMVQAQHQVIDRLLARVIELDHSFRPTQLPEWSVIDQSHALRAKARGER